MTRRGKCAGELGKHAITRDGVHRAEMPAQHDGLRVEHVHEVDQAHPQPVGHAGKGLERDLITALGFGEQAVEASGGGIACGAGERGVADLRLPAPLGTAAACVAGRIDAHVAHLAAVAARADQRTTVDEDTPTHADVAREIDHGAAVPRTAAEVLGEDSEIRVIAHADIAPSAADALAQEVPEGYVGPPQVGRESHESVGCAHDTGHACADADERCTGRQRLEHLATGLGDVVQECIAITPVVPTLGAREGLSAQAHQGGDRALDAHVQRQHRNGGGHGLHDQRRPTHSAHVPRPLADESQGRQGAHKVAHRAAVEPRRCRQVRARLRATEVEQPQHCGQVGAAYLVLRRAGERGHRRPTYRWRRRACARSHPHSRPRAARGP